MSNVEAGDVVNPKPTCSMQLPNEVDRCAFSTRDNVMAAGTSSRYGSEPHFVLWHRDRRDILQQKRLRFYLQCLVEHPAGWFAGGRGFACLLDRSGETRLREIEADAICATAVPGDSVDFVYGDARGLVAMRGVDTVQRVPRPRVSCVAAFADGATVAITDGVVDFRENSQVLRWKKQCDSVSISPSNHQLAMTCGCTAVLYDLRSVCTVGQGN
eukprot:NODE_874_length_1585_cov_64.295610_g863_i0.p1 GENE.NODE_874_length_1585_cov_64.295610_g863_i0~~NODE_874_length_1585_cov_64.295610_g863_i0.p1  ORF type:complete len:214 (-),score=34.19 NODE_874_length_1585_cov_64.295610_g863_i0:870-1511(-)